MKTFGTIEIVQKETKVARDDRPAVKRAHYRLVVQPHVAIRLKRIFPRVSTYAREHLDLLASDEIARELEWFMDLYSLESVDGALEHLIASARRHDASQELLAAMAAPDYVAPRVDLALPARDYQLVPAEIVTTTRGLLLGDEVGLGKTLVAIVLAVKPDTLPMVFVTKTDLPKQVQREFTRFAPALRTHVLGTAKSHGRKTEKGVRRGIPGMVRTNKPLDLAADIENGLLFPDVVLMSYSKLDGWANYLAPHVRSIVFDEVQELRNGSGTSKGAAANLLASKAQYRLGLSATPIYNQGSEIHAIMEFLVPDALGTFEEFSREWGGGWKGAVNDPKALGTYMRQRGVFLRRTRAEVGRELPELTITEHVVEHDAVPLDAIEGDATKLAQFILAGSHEKGESMTAGGELDWKLRQATGLAKAPYVAAFVQLLVESGEKVLLYGWHHAVYDLLAERLKDLKPAFYTGRETLRQREESKRRFVAGETSVLIMSLRSGAGLDGLQYVPGCRTVVFGELDWSPGVHEQAIGRVHRDGISDQVAAYFLVCEDGSDPIISETLGLKGAQIRGLRDPNAPDAQLRGSDEQRARTLAERYLRGRQLAVSESGGAYGDGRLCQ